MIYTKEYVLCSRCGFEEEIKDNKYPWRDLPCVVDDVHVCPHCQDDYYNMNRKIKAIKDKFYKFTFKEV